MDLRQCFRPPIPEIEAAAANLDNAVAAHLLGDREAARELFRLADDKAVWNWTDSIWGARSPYLTVRSAPNVPPTLPEAERIPPRMATAQTKAFIHQRDGYYCRFCKILVIRSAIRSAAARTYPDVVPWGGTNATQHAGFQCMWAQYDHIVPHSRGGRSDIGNIVLTCAACNYGRMHYTLEEVGLIHPDLHEARRGPWDGLERFR